MVDGLAIQEVHSAEPLLLASKHAYHSGSNSSDDDVPLSMRFMHKPSRAVEELRKASDDTLNVTRRNSLRNAHQSPSLEAEETSLPLHIYERSPGPEKANLVRKKSGEIVKLLLKEPILTAEQRSRSLPSTPTYKLVHFGGDNDVRYFKMKDKPTAILASNSPTLFPEEDDTCLPDLDDYSSTDDTEEKGPMGRFSLFNQSRALYFDYFDDELNSHVDSAPLRSGKRTDTHYPRQDWTLELIEFPLLLYHANIVLRSMSVFLERIFLSVDNKYLLGQVAVRNLAYEKRVTVRYTLDSWATIVEIPCLYVPDLPPVLRVHNYDRFVFKIPLDSFFNGFANTGSEGSREHFCQLCVKFSTATTSSWDNNEEKNYLFKLAKAATKPAAGPSQASQPGLPQAARTKQEAHTKKPKYSLSYLKKKGSNSTLPEPSTTELALNASGLASKEVDAVAQVPFLPHNDFVRNNFYLSLPLFSSLNNKDAEDLVRGEPRTVARTENAGESKTDASGGSTSSEMFAPLIFNDGDVPPEAIVPISPLSSTRDSKEKLKHMSYKELLESYCFFTTPQDDSVSKSPHVTSDEPGGNYKENFSAFKPINSGDSSSVFTVSSFLKN